ncbi:MAG: DnaA/Hda family protein [Rhodospirillales bacterium]|nr:DnaA/Hda family protein [Rhodospirillales bacterium]
MALDPNSLKPYSQLPLEFDHRPSLSGEDFLVTDSNRNAVAWLDKWPDWPSPALAVHGPAGCGKTHLSKVFMARSGAREMSLASLADTDLPQLLESARAFIIENADTALTPGLEVNLLHFYNLARETDRTLLFTARQAPSRWKVGLKDLRSRLNAVTAVAIGEPDDALIGALLVKLFADRQLRIEPDVLPFMVSRMERSFEAARQLVARADEMAMAERRNITLPLIRRVLQQSEHSTQ